MYDQKKLERKKTDNSCAPQGKGTYLARTSPLSQTLHRSPEACLCVLLIPIFGILKSNK